MLRRLRAAHRRRRAEDTIRHTLAIQAGAASIMNDAGGELMRDWLAHLEDEARDEQ